MDELLCNEENVVASPKGGAAIGAQVADSNPVEVFRLMVQREAAYGQRNAKYLAEIQRHGMDELWRKKICRWMFETAKAFELTHDTVASAIHFMDHYLSTKSVDKILLQLVSMVSMYIASKMHEHQPISMEEMELLSLRKFTREDIRRVESHLLQTVKWKLTPPTPFMFARDLIHMLKSVSDSSKAELEEKVMEFLQEVTEDYGSLRFTSSSLGVAAVHVVWNARRMRPSIALQEAITATEISGEDLVPAFRWLRELYRVVFQHQGLPRFVSVEESKMADASRSISPTSVDDAAMCGGAARGDAIDEAVLREVMQIPVDHSKRPAVTPERDHKRARHEL